MKKVLFILLSFSFLITSCKNDDVNCDNAQLCVKNIGTDVIHYSWGSSVYTDSILPGGKACKDVGQVQIDETTEITPWIPFNSSHGDYMILVDNCYVEKEIE